MNSKPIHTPDNQKALKMAASHAPSGAVLELVQKTGQKANEILDFVHTESIFYKYYMERIREILGGKTPQDYSQMSKNRAAAAKQQQENKSKKAA